MSICIQIISPHQAELEIKVASLTHQLENSNMRIQELEYALSNKPEKIRMKKAQYKIVQLKKEIIRNELLKYFCKDITNIILSYHVIT